MCTCSWSYERQVSAFIANWIPDVRVDFWPLNSGAPTWRLHTKLYKVAWSAATNNSETMYCTDLRIGEVVYKNNLICFLQYSKFLAFFIGHFEVFFFVAWQCIYSLRIWKTEPVMIIQRILIAHCHCHCHCSLSLHLNCHSRITTIPFAFDHDPFNFEEKKGSSPD